MAKNTTRRAHAVGRALNDSAAVPEGNSYGSEADFLARVLADPEVPVDFTDYLANVIIDIQGDVSLWTPEVLRVAWPLIRRQPGNGGAGLWIAIAEAFKTFADDDTRELLRKLGGDADEGGVH